MHSVTALKSQLCNEPQGSKLSGTLWRTGKWGRTESRLALMQVLKQELRFLVERGQGQKPITKVIKGQGRQVVSKDEPGRRLYFWRLLWLRRMRAISKMDSDKKKKKWTVTPGEGRPLVFEEYYATPKASEEPSLLNAWVLWQGDQIHTALALPKPR